MKTKSTYSLATFMASLSYAAWIQAASTVQFSAASYTAAENADAAMLTVQRKGYTNTGMGVYYPTADGTATIGLE